MMMKKVFVFFSVFLFAVSTFEMIVGLLGIPMAQAAVFTVDDTVADGDPGSLRDAIEQANAAVGVDTIILQPGRYLLNMGQLEIQQNLVIRGRGADRTIIDGGGNDRVFSITTVFNPDVSVQITGVTITGGFFQNLKGSVHGGGIYNEGRLTVRGVKVVGNIIESATDGLYSGYAFGGGICSFGVDAELTLVSSEVSENQALSDFDEAGSYGGGIYSEGALNIRRSKFNGNMVFSGEWASGGGICIGGDHAKFTLMGSHVTNNSADGSWWAEGSGISIHGDNAVLTLVRSNIEENTLYGDTAQGGGINIYSDDVVLKLNRSQVSRNIISGYNAFGGGINTSSSNAVILFTGGRVSDNSVRGYNNAFGGGISNSWGKSRLVLKGSHVVGNELTGDLQAFGGGIYWYGNLNVRRSKVIGNTVESLITGEYENGYTMSGARGGGIYSNGNNRFNLIGSRVTRNTASSPYVQEGGGVWVGSKISYTQTRSAVRNNSPDQVFIESDE
jgi:hypothetical protein